ncbi:MAG: 4-alpha-glucanotransferase [Lachnospiraceae bacterium]|nr:4-alpha-glucanotransferase [Lachnospiraceae bacterium]
MRKSGILMHITSLPSPYGIGTLGKEARAFVDFLEKAGQSCWQVLPLGQTGYGDSPYQSCSLYAGNPYLIDLDKLVEEGYLTKKEIEEVAWGEDPEKVDFGLLYERRYPLFRKAFARFRENIPEDYDAFGWEQGQWLEDYALFMAIKTEAGGVAWDQWDESLRRREPAAIVEAKKRLGMEMFFWKMLQYFFFRQWQDLKEYAHEKGILIIGDTPIYAAYDSADVWAQPWLFSLDEEGRQVEVAGCPPDAFSEDGQLWGNPVFRWDVMQRDGYDWWIRRIRHNLKVYDVLRIDHFRGFDSYYCIPAGNKNAKIGWWRQGPGMDFFRKVQQVLGKNLPLIAEDLGDITPSVQAMLAESGYPGMKVLQFAFGGGAGNAYLPQNHRENAVVYTGTHDNTTNLGWWKQISRKEKTVMRDRLHLDKNADPNWGLMQAAMESVCDTAILTMQDLLELGGEARMNTPSTAGGNWVWRAKKGYLTKKLAGQLHRMTERANRLPGFGGEEAPWAFQTALGDKLPGWEKRLPADPVITTNE